MWEKKSKNKKKKLQLIHHQARPAGVKPGGLAEERWAEAVKTGRKALAAEMASRESIGRAGNMEPAATSWRSKDCACSWIPNLVLLRSKKNESGEVGNMNEHVSIEPQILGPSRPP